MMDGAVSVCFGTLCGAGLLPDCSWVVWVEGCRAPSGQACAASRATDATNAMSETGTTRRPPSMTGGTSVCPCIPSCHCVCPASVLTAVPPLEDDGPTLSVSQLPAAYFRSSPRSAGHESDSTNYHIRKHANDIVGQCIISRWPTWGQWGRAARPTTSSSITLLRLASSGPVDTG